MVAETETKECETETTGTVFLSYVQVGYVILQMYVENGDVGIKSMECRFRVRWNVGSINMGTPSGCKCRLSCTSSYTLKRGRERGQSQTLSTL